MSTIVRPLTYLLAIDVEWECTNECVQACQKAKKLLASSEVLAHYDASKPVILVVDISSHGLGAVISHQIDNSEERPIAYASRTLTSAERNYSMIEKEALTVVLGIKRFISTFMVDVLLYSRITNH